MLFDVIIRIQPELIIVNFVLCERPSILEAMKKATIKGIKMNVNNLSSLYSLRTLESNQFIGLNGAVRDVT